MLAQNFKTAADLGILDADLDALIKTLGMLERNEVVHVQVKDVHEISYSPLPDGLFNMGNIYVVADCGTAACIAGTADLFCGSKFVTGHGLRSGLPDNIKRLFCPPIDEDDWENISVEQAARALRSYLTTGDANWDEALA